MCSGGARRTWGGCADETRKRETRWKIDPLGVCRRTRQGRRKMVVRGVGEEKLTSQVWAGGDGVLYRRGGGVCKRDPVSVTDSGELRTREGKVRGSGGGGKSIDEWKAVGRRKSGGLLGIMTAM